MGTSQDRINNEENFDIGFKEKEFQKVTGM